MRPRKERPAPQGLVVLPYRLEDCWNDYIERWSKREGQDFRRVQYVANGWLRIMGKDSDVSGWRIADVERYVDQRLSEGPMPTTVKREMSLMKAALNKALQRERLDRVPYFGMPSGESRRRRPLTEEELDRLLASKIPRRVWMFYSVSRWTGHRSRAIETLPWARVNWEARTIDFNEPGARRTNKRRVDGFPIPDELYPILVAAKKWADRRAPNDPYVIGLGPRGKCSTTFHACKAALKAIGIDEAGICRHTVRGTFVTERIKRGVSRSVVADLIGDNPSMMDKHYVTLRTEDLRAGANMRNTP